MQGLKSVSAALSYFGAEIIYETSRSAIVQQAVAQLGKIGIVTDFATTEDSSVVA